MKAMKYYFVFISLLISNTSFGAYTDLVSYFSGINSSTSYPVSAKGFDDVESAFGIRLQTSTGGTYDWHRGIDIDGGSVGDPVGIFDIVAPYAGEFYDYRTTSSGGNIVILRHSFSSPITYGGQSLSNYYTWYLHLYDDGIVGNGIGTSDIVSGYTRGDAIAQDTVIGKMGDTGSPAGGGTYAPHLHFELRVGTNSSLEFQQNNPETTQWGFDPHMNPFLLFEPYTYGGTSASEYDQTLALDSAVAQNQDVTVNYVITNDDIPVFNEVKVTVKNTNTNTEVTSHTLDLNQRTGFDATSTANLDTQDTSVPYVDPVASQLSGGQYSSTIVIPSDWTSSYQDSIYEVTVMASDIWSNTESMVFNLVPEPSDYAVIISGITLGLVYLKRRR